MSQSNSLPAVVLIACCCLWGCAYTEISDDGSKRIVGLVDLKISSDNEQIAIAGEVIRVRSIGLAILATPINSSITLGYSDNELAAVKDNIFVVGNPLSAMRNMNH